MEQPPSQLGNLCWVRRLEIPRHRTSQRLERLGLLPGHVPDLVEERVAERIESSGLAQRETFGVLGSVGSQGGAVPRQLNVQSLELVDQRMIETRLNVEP